MSDVPTTPVRLTVKQQRFVDLYLGECRFNASAAALAAGYSVRQSGHELLSNPVIRARVDQLVADTSVSRDEFLGLLADDARQTDDAILAQAIPLDRAVAAAFISSRLGARTSARQILAKHYGFLTERVQVSGGIRREIVVRRPETAPVALRVVKPAQDGVAS